MHEFTKCMLKIVNLMALLLQQSAFTAAFKISPNYIAVCEVKYSTVKYTDTAVRSLTCHTATGAHMPYIEPHRGDIPAFTPAKAGTRLSDPGGMQGIERGWLATYWDGIPARRRSPIHVLTGPDVR